MSEMEQETRQFLLKIAGSLSIGALWLLINSTVGIFFGLAFFSGSPSLGNYIYYAWFLGSFIWLIFYYKRKWNF